MRFRLVILAYLLLFTQNACAWPVLSGIYGPLFPGPVLNSVAVNFGNLTPSGRGGVRLSAMDNTTLGFHFSGLGLQSPTNTPCALWTVARVSGTAGHWTIPAVNTPEGVAAITPVPSAAGVTAHLNGGPYTFSVNCTDAAGVTAAAPSTLTINIITDAVNIGTADSLSGYAPVGFGNTTGQKIFLSTGTDRSGIRSTFKNACAYVNTVIFTQADVARPAGLMNWEVQNCTNLQIDNITLTGDMRTAPSFSGFFYLNNVSNITMNNDAAILTETTLARTPHSAITLNGATDVTVNNFIGNYVASGITENQLLNTNVTFNNTRFRYFYNNCIFQGSGINFTYNDTYCIAPMRRDALHVDVFQIGDGASPANLSVNRFLSAQADGNAQSQGPPFGGTASSYRGYIDDGTASHLPGNVMTVTTVPTSGKWVNFATVVGAGVAADTVVQSRTTGNGAVGSTYLLATAGLPGGQIVGSPGSPATLYSAPLKNVSLRGLAHAGIANLGLTWTGEQGTSTIREFTQIKVNPQTIYATSFTGTISGTTLTASSVSGIAGIYAAQSLHYTGCNACTKIGHQLTGPVGGAGTYTLTVSETVVSPTAMTGTDDGPFTTGPRFQDGNVDLSIQHSGTMTVRGGFIFDQASFLNGDRTVNCVNPPTACTGPANTTITGLTVGGLTLNGAAAASAVSAASFKNGDPETSLEAISRATWAGMTIDQIFTTVSVALEPKTGGPLDAGSGNWYGAFKQDGTWNDGADVITTESGTTITTEGGNPLTTE